MFAQLIYLNLYFYSSKDEFGGYGVYWEGRGKRKRKREKVGEERDGHLPL